MANWFNKLKNRTRPNPKRFIGVVAVVFAAILSLGEASSWAQFGGSNNYGGGFYGGAGGGMENPDDPGVRAKMEASQRLANAMSEFHRAQGDDAKAAAQKKLLEALTKYFDADMKVREAGLQKVEAQVKTLRSQFDKRASKKQEILELQLKLLENETEGLGFFGAHSRTPEMMAAAMSYEAAAGIPNPRFGAPYPPVFDPALGGNDPERVQRPDAVLLGEGPYQPGLQEAPAPAPPNQRGGDLIPAGTPRPKETGGDAK